MDFIRYKRKKNMEGARAIPEPSNESCDVNVGPSSSGASHEF